MTEPMTNERLEELKTLSKAFLTNEHRMLYRPMLQDAVQEIQRLKTLNSPPHFRSCACLLYAKMLTGYEAAMKEVCQNLELAKPKTLLTAQWYMDLAVARLKDQLEKS